ncbi:conserved hypothetical protein [Candidatus Sulfopaludibacter sp. SbA4]|nr:conserved hypothetical protein [Candidatus Sulfopaludibacter sp. SbA4]
MPGVVVTATSPALQGQLTFVTNEQGDYRFPTMPLGVYRITYQSPGFATVVHEGVDVRLSFTDTINVQMAPAAQKDVVTVTGEAALVDTQSATVLGGFNKQQLTDIPNGRDMWSIIGLTPGMHASTLDVGGSAVGNQVAYTSYGYGGQNRVMIDGINTSEGTSGAGFYFDYGSFQEFTVGTAGNDASVPQPGNAINAVIRSGGNAFHGEMYFDYENPNFQGHNVSQEQVLQGAGSGQRTAIYYDFNGNFGGPIKKDRLWFFTSLRDQANAKTVTGFPIQAPGTVNSYAYDRNATYKVSGDISPKHRLSQYIQWNPILKPQRNSAAGLYQDAMQYQKAVAWVGNVQYTGTITPRLVVNALIGTWGYNFPLLNYTVFPGDPGTPTCPCSQNLPPVAVGQLAPRMSELVSGTTAGASAPTRSDPRRYQFEPSASYFLDNFLHANHQLKFGEVTEREVEEGQTYGSPGNVTETFNSKGPNGTALPDFSTPYQVTIANTPRVYTDVVMHHGAYFTDQVRIGKRLTLNVGARWDYYRSDYLPINLRTDCQFCPYFYQGVPLPNGASLPPIAVSGGFPGATVSRFPFLVAPRLAAVYDLTGKGKTVLRVNWGIYYSYPSTNIANAVDPLQSASATFTWNNPNNLPFNVSQLGAIVGSPKIAQGSSVQPHLQDGRFDDIGVVIEHQLTNTLSIRGGFIFREMHHDFQTINLALPAGDYTIPVQVKVPGLGYGLNGNTSDFQTITMWDVPKNLIGPTQNRYSSPAGNNSVYRNIEITVNKRLSNRFTAVANFYWTHTTTGNGGVAVDPDTLINNHESYSDWTAHFDATYRGPWGIDISPVLRMQAGTALGRTYNVTGLNIGTFNLLVDPVGTYRQDDLYVFDTRIEKQLRFRERFRLNVFLDAFNILNSNAANAQSSATGIKSTFINIAGNPAYGQTVQYQGFLSPTTILPPRIFRVGARFMF